MELLHKFISNRISLETTFDNFTEGLLIVDAEAEVIYLNEVARKICYESGSTPTSQWPKKMGLYQVNQKHLLTYEEMPIIQALKGREIKDYKLFIKNEENPEGLFLLASAKPLRNEDGCIAGAMVTFRDISKNLMRERKIVEERGFYQKILDLIPASITVQGLDGNYIFTNRYFLDVFRSKSVEGKTLKEIYNEQDRQLIQRHNEQVFKAKREMIFEEDFHHLDGNLHHYRSVRFPLLNSKREIDAFCCLALNETEKIKQAREIEAERIKNINASKLAALGTLAAEIGHEINNPLGIIKTSSLVLRQMVMEGSSKEMIEKQIGVIEETTTRIIDIVSALKHVSRDSQNEKMSNCSIMEVLNDVNALCSTKFKLKNIILSYKGNERILQKRVTCLRVQLSQVLLNLLINACDAVGDMQNPCVEVLVDEDESSYFFRVKDSGPGVPLEIQDKIFEPFFTTKSLGMGTGLGLSISKEIMLRQGGDVYLDTLSEKSCFIIKLPKNG